MYACLLSGRNDQVKLLPLPVLCLDSTFIVIAALKTEPSSCRSGYPLGPGRRGTAEACTLHQFLRTGTPHGQA